MRPPPRNHGYRFSPEITSHAVWLYHRFCLSFPDTEDLLAQRASSCPTRRFGNGVARSARRMRTRCGAGRDAWATRGTWTKLFVSIRGRQQCLWRAVDHDGDVIEILMQPRRDRDAADRFFRKLLKGRGWTPHRLIADKLRSYAAATDA
jgi:putative transposase